jgi:hypothetical protein
VALALHKGHKNIDEAWKPILPALTVVEELAYEGIIAETEISSQDEGILYIKKCPYPRSKANT